MKHLLSKISNHKDLLLVIAVIGILLMLFVPIPALFLDLMLIANFSLAILILLLTFYTDKPLSFSTLPSLLLIATLFRLALNISSTRLILNDANAGEVIDAIGSYVVGGNYVIGMVVFFILIVVQYVVVTNGAGRVAEVAARFTLDSMPGKQMSIDADLNMGLIDEIQAKERRSNIEKEANFYGAMDGASKFVKGDAIAGIIIILINIIAGLSIGVAQLGMSWGDALHLYTLLTVGDGIVTQIPSLIIATATGIIITRAATDDHLGGELANQITSAPKPLFIVSAALFIGVVLPGLPSAPLLVLSVLFLLLGVFSLKAVNKADLEGSTEKPKAGPNEESDDKSDLNNLLTILPLELSVSNNVALSIEKSGDVLTTRFQAFKKQSARELGFIIPEIKLIKETTYNEFEYELRILGSRVGKGTVHYDKYLVIDPKGDLSAVQGIKSKEPTYGLPAAWVEESQVSLAKRAGYTVVDAETTILTHITELVKSNAWELLTRSETEKLVNRLESSHSSLLDELIPNVMSYSDIQKVLQSLLKEKISIRNMEMILECLVDKGKESKESIFLSEQVRYKLKSQIVNNLLDSDDMLNVITMEPLLEQQVISGLQAEQGKVSLALQADVTENIIQQLAVASENAISQRITPILVCHSPIRLALKQLLDRVLPQLNVLAVTEIPQQVSVKNIAVISLNQTAKAA